MKTFDSLPASGAIRYKQAISPSNLILNLSRKPIKDDQLRRIGGRSTIPPCTHKPQPRNPRFSGVVQMACTEAFRPADRRYLREFSLSAVPTASPKESACRRPGIRTCQK